MNLIHPVEQLFLQHFEKTPAVYLAPGRINLIGEHVDYNDGLVMPAAIDRHVVLAAQRNFSDHFRFYSPDFKESASFTLADVKPGSHWTNYLMGRGGRISEKRNYIGERRCGAEQHHSHRSGVVFFCRPLLRFWFCPE